MLLCVIAPASQDSLDGPKYLVAASNSFVVVLLPLRHLMLPFGPATNRFCLDSSSWRPQEVCPQTLHKYVAYTYQIQYWEHDQDGCDYVLQVAREQQSICSA